MITPMPVEQYVAGLNRKRMAAGVLFRDTTGRVLLVEPSWVLCEQGRPVT